MKNIEHPIIIWRSTGNCSAWEEIARSFIYCKEFKMRFTDLRLHSIASCEGKMPFNPLLDDIPGIGEKRKKLLLKHFGSVKKMKEASIRGIHEDWHSR